MLFWCFKFYIFIWWIVDANFTGNSMYIYFVKFFSWYFYFAYYLLICCYCFYKFFYDAFMFGRCDLGAYAFHKRPRCSHIKIFRTETYIFWMLIISAKILHEHLFIIFGRGWWQQQVRKRAPGLRTNLR